MATTYEMIIRQGAKRCNAIIAANAQAGAIETAYATSPITSTQLNSPDFPWTSWKDSLITAEEKLARRIANNPHCSYRTNITSQTALLVNLAALPSVDSGSNKIIGEWGDVKDASDGRICTLKPIPRIARILRLNLKGSYYHFNLISGQRITHTRSSVVIDVCTFNRTSRTTAINTITNPILLSDALEEAYVCGLVSMIVGDDNFSAQATIYRGHFDDTLKEIDAMGREEEMAA
jgi:hypothetical protein